MYFDLKCVFLEGTLGPLLFFKCAGDPESTLIMMESGITNVFIYHSPLNSELLFISGSACLCLSPAPHPQPVTVDRCPSLSLVLPQGS